MAAIYKHPGKIAEPLECLCGLRPIEVDPSLPFTDYSMNLLVLGVDDSDSSHRLRDQQETRGNTKRLLSSMGMNVRNWQQYLLALGCEDDGRILVDDLSPELRIRVGQASNPATLLLEMESELVLAEADDRDSFETWHNLVLGIGSGPVLELICNGSSWDRCDDEGSYSDTRFQYVTKATTWPSLDDAPVILY